MEYRTDITSDNTSYSSEETEDHLWEQRYQILYRCRLSARYHRRRERFFDLMGRFATAIALFSGSAALAAAGTPWAVQIAAVMVVFSTILSLVFGFSDKARQHSTMAESYKRIEAEMHRAGDYDYTERAINIWKSQIAEIESGEPQTLRTLVTLCQNEIAAAENQPDKIIPVPMLQRMFAHFFDVSAGKVVSPFRRKREPGTHY